MNMLPKRMGQNGQNFVVNTLTTEGGPLLQTMGNSPAQLENPKLADGNSIEVVGLREVTASLLVLSPHELTLLVG
jgi:hypothetical protein